MSFPKAKLLRFNEISTCAPPPGKYDPKYDQKIKGAVIEKSKRFVDTKLEAAPSVTSHDSASSCSHNYNPAATFRTPQLPRKARLVSTPRSAVERPTARHPKQPTPECKTRKKLDLGYETEQNLIEQINELTRVHTSQLLDKDQELVTLQREMADLRAEMSKVEKNHIVDYNTMKQAYEKAIEKMKCELEELSVNAEKEKTKTDAFIAELKTKVAVLQENVNNSNAICGDLEYQLAEANIKLIEAKNEYADLEEQLKRARVIINDMIESKKRENNWFVSAFPEHLEEVVVAAEKNLDDLTIKMKERLKILERDLEIERMETHRDFTSVIDSLSDEVKDRVDLFEQKSKSLQEEIKITSDGFDCKISDLVNSIAESANVNDKKLRENLLLTEELEKAKAANVEKKIVIVDLQSRIDELQDRLTQLTNQCRKYEIVQVEATKTIHVLSQRLFESETEVERLNDTTEELMLRRDALEGKVKSVVDENNVLKMDIHNLEVSLARQVKDLENSLVAKVETYRRLAIEETQKLKFELDERQRTVEMLMKEVDYHRTKAVESAEYIDLCQSRIVKYKEELAAMLGKIAALEEDYNDKLGAQKALVLETTKQLEETKKKIAEKTEQLNAKSEQKIALLRQENEHLASKLKNLSENILEKDLCLGSLTQELEEVKIYNEKLTSKISSLAVKLAVKESQFDELSQEVEVKNVTMGKISEEYESMKKLYEDKCRKSDAVEQDHITTIAILEADLHQMVSHNQELTESLNKVEAESSKTVQSLAERTEELGRIKDEKSTLELRIVELEGLALRAEEDGKALTKEKEDLMELVKRQWEDRELLTNQIESQQEEIEELKQMRDDRLEEEKAIYQAELQNEIFALQQSLEDTQRRAIDLQSLYDEMVFKLNSAESELNAAEAENERQESAMKDLVDKLSTVELRCSAAEKRKNEYKQYATTLESEKEVLLVQIAELVEEKGKLLDEKLESSMQLDSMSARLADQEIRTREAETRCRELETMVEPFQEQLAAYEKERAALLAKSASTEKELEDLTKEYAKAIGHQNIRQKIHRVQQLTETNSKLKQENEKLLSENAKLRTTLMSYQDGSVKRAAKSKTFKDGKENDSSRIPTPQPPHSPLKVRNVQN